MSKTLTLVYEDKKHILVDKEIIDMELKINLLNYDRKYYNIAKECYDLYCNNFIHHKKIDVTSKEFEYVLALTKRSYQELFNEKYTMLNNSFKIV
jgi:hypothetical protein